MTTVAFDRRNIDVEDYLECLDMRNVSRATSEEWRFSCPYPNHLNGDENASAYMNDETAAFYCHGCKHRGDAVTLAAFVLEVSHLEAIRMLRERYQQGYLNPDARNVREEVLKLLENDDQPAPTHNDPFDAGVLDALDVDWHKVASFTKFAPPEFSYMLQRGYTPDTLEHWRFGYHSRTDRITFPVHDAEGQLIGIKGRAWEKGREPKYLVLGDVPNKPQRYGFPRYQTGLCVFGLHEALRSGSDTAVICEGELNAVACWQAGIKNAVAVNGSNFTDVQRNIIMRHFNRAIVFFDSDPAGHDGTWGWTDTSGKYHPGVVEKLHKHISVSVAPDHDGDPGDMIQEGRIDYLHECIEQAESAVKIAVASTL